MIVGKFQRGTAAVLVMVLMLSATGCTSLAKHYGIQPTMTQTFIQPGQKCPEGTSTEVPASTPPTTGPVLKASDMAVLCYTNALVLMLRKRFNVARIARTLSGVGAVLTAASAAALTAAGGPGTAVLALATTSAIIPELASIIDARERAKAYEEGLGLIGDAYSHYLQSIAQSHKGKISDNELTPAGARLFSAVNASLHVVESLLAAQLPTVEILQRARTQHSLGVTLAFATTELSADKPLEITASGGVPPHRADASPLQVSTTTAAGTTTIKLFARGTDAGSYPVVIKDSQGNSANLTVTVVGATPLTATAVVPTVRRGSPALVAVTGGVKPYLVGVDPASPLIVALNPGDGPPLVTVALKPGAQPAQSSAPEKYAVRVVDKDSKSQAVAEVTVVWPLALVQQGTAQPTRGGELVFAAVGGLPPYTVIGPLQGGAGALTVRPGTGSNLPPGTPNVVVTVSPAAAPGTYYMAVGDATGAEATAGITIPVALVAAPPPPACPKPGGSLLVCRVQQALLEAGFDPRGIDGLEGARTRAALNAYQERNDLAKTATVDDAPTLAKLRVAR